MSAKYCEYTSLVSKYTTFNNN